MQRFSSMLGLAALLASAAAAQAPSPAATPGPTSEEAVPKVAPEMREAVDRAPKSYDEWAKIYFQVLKLLKEDAVVLPGGEVKALRLFAGRIYELVGEDERFYYVRNLPLEDPRSAGHRGWRRAIGTDIFDQRRNEFYEGKYLIGDMPDVDPPFTDKLQFVRRDKGLPEGGRFQTSLDIADMNGDGRLDLVLPPVRMGPPYPSIVLQQADGTWRPASDLKWPQNARFDYGAVRVADFDLDGHLDLALACHFNREYVLYGNGKGDFTRHVVLPRGNAAISARSLVVADFNLDGRMDVAALAETNLDMGTHERAEKGLVNILLNLRSGWKLQDQAFAANIQGDWLSTGDIDADGDQDLLLTSTSMTIRDLIWRNDGSANFTVVASESMPPAGYAFSNAAAPMDGFAFDDLILCFEQFNPYASEPPAQACGIFHFHDAEGRPTDVPTVTLFFKKEEEYNTIEGVAVGDVDGDGRNDVALITFEGGLRLFLQFPDGSLYEERGSDLSLPEGTAPFDIKIRDLDGDGRGEVVVMGAPEKQQGGGVWVFSPKPKAAGAKS